MPGKLFPRGGTEGQPLQRGPADPGVLRRTVEPCRCECGYRCGGPGVCQIRDCYSIADGKHWVRDCDHRWDGATEEESPFGGSAIVTSATCGICGMTLFRHDFAHGA